MPDQSIAEKIESLYGEVDWAKAAGCLHVAAIHGPSGRVIALGPDAPPSATDRFVLGFARARARVILTTGAIFRAEPDLEHRYADEPASDERFAGWRRGVLGVDTTAELLILTGSGVLDSAHVGLREARGVLYTSRAGAERLGHAPAGFETVVGEGGAGMVQEATRFAMARAAGGSVLIEAGPTTSRSLYLGTSSEAPEPPETPAVPSETGVDELLLSRYEGDLKPAAIGPSFIEEDRLEARFGSPVSSRLIEEPSGRWRFERYVASG